MMRTRRLVLRELEPDDSASLATLLRDRDVMRHYPAVLTADVTAAWIGAMRGLYREWGLGLWTTTLHDGTFVGQCGILPQDVEGAREFEIAVFFHRAYWRDGYADEATGACVDYAFQSLDATRIIGLIYPENRPSVRLAHRMGLRFDRRVKHNGEDMALYVRFNRGRAAVEA